MNKVLMWLVIVLLIISQGFMAYKLNKVDHAVTGLTILIMTTNQEASALVKKLIPLANMKDNGVKSRLINREIMQRNADMEEILGNRTQTR